MAASLVPMGCTWQILLLNPLFPGHKSVVLTPAGAWASRKP